MQVAGRRQRHDGQTRAVGYVRVSTREQADRGVSLEAQQAKIRAYSQLYSLGLVPDPETGRDVIVDAGESAKTLERPGLQRALRMLRGGQADALVVVKLDRLTRSVKDLGALLEGYFASGRYGLLCVQEQVDTRSAAGRMVLNILVSVAQWEREAIGERTSAAHRHKLAQGEYVGGDSPYGFSIGDCGRLVPLAEEQRVIEVARILHADGISLRRVAAQLEERGHLSRTGRPFAPAQVARMVGSRIGAPS